ncbi:unnamed protein product, partial [Rotaria magnacalcarata]
ATKPGVGRRSKLTDRQKRVIKLQQVRDDTLSLNDLIRYVQTSFNITVNRRTVSRILNEFDMFSYVAPRKPRINHRQRYSRLQWCYQHLSWAEKDWSNVIFTDESNFEILNRKNRIYTRRFRKDLKRFERSQPRVHKGGALKKKKYSTKLKKCGVGIWSYLTCHGLGPIVFYDGSLNSDKYIDILDQHLPTAYEKFLPQSPHSKIFQEKKINPISWPPNSADLNLIENMWSILDDKLLKYNINNTEQLKTALKMAWMEISNDTIQKLFESMSKRIRQIIKRRGFASHY